MLRLRLRLMPCPVRALSIDGPWLSIDHRVLRAVVWRRLSRCFLFGSRDLWFEVPLPFFLRDHVFGLGLERRVVGAFLAIYIIIYGMMQSYTPQLVVGPLRQVPPNKYVACLWALMLIPTALALALVVLLAQPFVARNVPQMLGAMIAGVVLFALVFAVNSSVHSYLVVRYAAGDKVGWHRGGHAWLGDWNADSSVAPASASAVAAGRDRRGLLLHGQRCGQAGWHPRVRGTLLSRLGQHCGGFRGVHVRVERVLPALCAHRLPVQRRPGRPALRPLLCWQQGRGARLNRDRFDDCRDDLAIDVTNTIPPPSPAPDVGGVEACWDTEGSM